jgi:hypothetical protein
MNIRKNTEMPQVPEIRLPGTTGSYLRPTFHVVSYRLLTPSHFHCDNLPPCFETRRLARKPGLRNGRREYLHNNICRLPMLNTTIYLKCCGLFPQMPVLLEVHRDCYYPDVDAYDLTAETYAARFNVAFNVSKVEVAFDWINPPWRDDLFFDERLVVRNLLKSSYSVDVGRTFHIGAINGHMNAKIYGRHVTRDLDHKCTRLEFTFRFPRNGDSTPRSLAEFLGRGQFVQDLEKEILILDQSILEQELPPHLEGIVDSRGAQGVYNELSKHPIGWRWTQDRKRTFFEHEPHSRYTTILLEALRELVQGWQTAP